MGKPRRQPISIWQQTRDRIWQRDQGRCQGPYCTDQPANSLPLKIAHIDHIVELTCGGTNADSNLRILCRFCHCLRSSTAHRGMIAQGLQDGLLPVNWREWLWEG